MSFRQVSYSGPSPVPPLLAGLAAAACQDKQEPHPFGSGCGGLEGGAENDEMGCAQCAHFGLRIGPYIGRTGSDRVCFRGSGEFAGAGMRFESHLGHVFSLFRGLRASECAQNVL